MNTPLFLLFEFCLLLNSPSSRLLLADQLSKLVSGFYIEVKYKVQHFKTIVTFIMFNHCVFSIPTTRLRDNTHNSLKNHNYTITNQKEIFHVFDYFKIAKSHTTCISFVRHILQIKYPLDICSSPMQASVL